MGSGSVVDEYGSDIIEGWPGEIDDKESIWNKKSLVGLPSEVWPLD